ncbi:MAG: NAD(P)/FAD-dependent oxidoreductase [Acutalibacter sp.]|jgi:NAD(P)H-nitrite reductase large subunit
MDYVILGNSAAAVGCMEGIRSVDPEGKITVIASEKYHTYSRPLISYLLEGKTDLDRMKYRPDSYYKDMGVETRLGEKAVAIKPQEHKVVLEDGQEVSYDKLLVATGSTPFVPPMEGLETVKEKFTFLSLDDAKGLEATLTPDTRVFIVGAGLIGLKCAEGIAHRVKSVEIADLASQVLPSILDQEGAARVQSYLEEQGLTFYLGDTAQKFEGNTAHLKSGRKVEFDVLVLAVGVRPNVSLVKDAGGQVNRGIVADDCGRTSLPDVYAAGDCCESHDITSGEHRVLALLPNAYFQGECAGKSMAGEDSPFTKAVPMNAIGFFGLHLITAGSYRGEKLVAQDEKNYKAFFVEDGLLKGYILVGDCLENAGVYTSLIRDQVSLDTVDFDLLRERPQFMAFSVAKRREMFGR